METRNEIEILQKIKRVEAPKDMYDTILTQIKPTQKVSWSLGLAASIAFFLLVATNIWFFNQNLNSNQEYNITENSYFETVLSNTSNQLYNE